MVLESFLILLNALISLNAPTETQKPTPLTRTEIHKKDIREAPTSTELCRGGWDGN
jgi:hypothetical protein